MGDLPPDLAPEPTLLVVGDGEPLIDGIAEAAARHGLAVERSTLELCAQTAVAVAPDAVLLVGDAAKDGGAGALKRLGSSPLAAVVPVVLFGDADEDLSGRLAAFRLGVTAYVPRSASVDEVGRRLTELVRDIPDRAGTVAGRVGEASLDQFVETIARELRQGILSVRGDDASGEGEEVRLVLGEGVGVDQAMQQFVERIQALIERTEVVHYEWEGQARGGLSLLSSLGGERDDALPSIYGARVLLADDDVARADVIAQELRTAGAIVAVVEPQGRGLARARALDPQALVVGESVVHGPGFALVRRLRDDARMRWAHMIVVPWDEIWTEGTAPPRLDSLVRRIARATEVEQAFHSRLAGKSFFDVRLEALGAARLLRQLGREEGRTLRLTVWNLRATVRVDVGEGLIIGASAIVPGRKGNQPEGIAALASLLPMATGRARVEQVQSPLATNVMSPVEEALGQAEEEAATTAPEPPPQTLRQRAAGSVFPVAVARTEPPPSEPGVEMEAVPRPPPPPTPSPRAQAEEARGAPAPPIDRLAAVRALAAAVVPPPSDEHEVAQRDDPTLPQPPSDELVLAMDEAQAPPPPEPPSPPALRPPAMPEMPLAPEPPEPEMPLAPEPPEPATPEPAVARVARAPSTRRSKGRRSSGAGCLWAVASLAAVGVLLGAAWWTGWPPEAWAGAPVSPRVDRGPVAQASRPIEPDAWEPIVPSEDGDVELEPHDDPDDERSDSEWSEDERPEEPHRPPTERHPYPEGADDSFEVPEWMTELGPITRGRRGRQMRVLGSRNLKSRRYDRALRWFRRSWWFDESSATAQGVGSCYLGLGDTEQAWIWAEKAVDLDRANADAQVLLGEVLLEQGRFTEAEITFQHALDLEARHRRARRSLRRLEREMRAARQSH